MKRLSVITTGLLILGITVFGCTYMPDWRATPRRFAGPRGSQS